MTSEPKDREKEVDNKFAFIKEEIVPKKKGKVKRLCIIIGGTIGLAVLFGLISSFIFYVSGSYFDKKLKDNEDKKQIVFPTETATETSKQKEKNKATPTPEVKVETNVVVMEANLKDYAKMYSLLAETANMINKSIVTVYSVNKNVDLFNNPYETSDATYGIIVGNNNKELLILTSRDKIKDAKNIRIKFINQSVVDTKVYAQDKDTGLSILSVPISKVSESTMKQIEIADLGESFSMHPGTPIIALGSPNGYVYSMSLGIISGKSHEVYIPDYKIDLFTTDIEYNQNGEGVIIDLNGKVTGIITHKFADELNENLHTVIGISKLKRIIEELVNGKERVYFGVKSSDIPLDMEKKLDVDNGIYVTAVVANSPAYDAGIQIGDVITTVEEESISSVTDFYDIITEYQVKDILEVKVVRTSRDNKEFTLEVTLDEKG